MTDPLTFIAIFRYPITHMEVIKGRLIVGLSNGSLWELWQSKAKNSRGKWYKHCLRRGRRLTAVLRYPPERITPQSW